MATFFSRKSKPGILGLILALTGCPCLLQAEVVAEITSPYHHIKVVDEGGFRILSFDGSMESRISLSDPLKGHFEYTRYFHTAWLWNPKISNVLIVGLGGGTTQQTFAHYYPGLSLETVELDPQVVSVARQYFNFLPNDQQKVTVGDGRQYLRRSRKTYDLIIMDAYSHNRYGSFLPHHLATKEFFDLASKRLSTNGVMCYNIMGSLSGAESGLVGAVYKTMNAVFPKVTLFSAVESRNVVLLASRQKQHVSFNDLHQRASGLIRKKVIKVPKFRDLLYKYRSQPPAASFRAKILTDDFAPIEGLMKVQPRPQDLKPQQGNPGPASPR